ncbi:MAG: flagellar motor protein MotB [Deltaproteobacteria bacterium]|nr:flagellar motor protein MotB [Deltaproteobacteria bacterium]NNK86169.1 flagellar motor protein MotB [Desulfobacterales bacterium]
MSKNRLFYISCFVCMLFLSCVSKGKYLELETDLQNTQQKLEQNQKELADLQDKHSDLENEKQNLVQTSRDLSLKLQKEKEVVKEKTKVISTLEETKNKIEEGLKEQIANQQVKIEDIEGKLKLTFIDKILFNSGSTKINKKGKEILLSFTESIREDRDHNILAEGHTDNVSVGSALKSKFPSNWELSTARASAVVRYLQEKGGIEPERLSAIGYSYFKPVASNDDEEGRSQNRRIEIILTRKK